MNISFSINDDILLALKEGTPEFTRDLRFFAALMSHPTSRAEAARL